MQLRKRGRGSKSSDPTSPSARVISQSWLQQITEVSFSRSATVESIKLLKVRRQRHQRGIGNRKIARNGCSDGTRLSQLT